MSNLSQPDPALGLACELTEAVAVPTALAADGRLLYANAAWLRLGGRSLADLATLPPAGWLVADDRTALLDALGACRLNDVPPPALSLRLAAHDGSERPVEVSLRPLDAGAQVLVVITCVDLSDIHHVQNTLFGLSEMLRQIIDGAAVASFVLDAEHRVTHWNGACERLTGRTRSQMIGSADAGLAFFEEPRPLLADLIVDGVGAGELCDRFEGQAHVSPLVAGGYEAEAFFPHLGEGGRWLFMTAAPLRDGEGRIIGAIETLQDVTERRHAEDELMRHRNQLEELVQQRSAELAATARDLAAFIDNAPIGVAYSERGRVDRVNRTFAAMFGYTTEAAQGRDAADFHVGAAEHAALNEAAAKVLVRGEPFTHEMWMRHAEGRPIWVQMSAHLADARHAGHGVWWMMQDRTDFRVAQEQLQARFEELRETNRMLEQAQNQLLQKDKMASIGQLAAGVAHELSNPIGYVNSNLNTLRQYAMGLLTLAAAHEQAGAHPGDGEAAQAVERARADVELDYLREDLPQLLDECAEGLGRVKKIVQDLKDFSRVDQSEWQEADLNAGLESTLNVVRHEVKYKVEVVRRLGTVPLVNCLAAQLNQVFLNLIVNAVHAIADKGVVTLSSGHADGWAWVQIDDTGCGMTEEVRRRIFEPFFTTKEVGKGTGLGLSLSFSIVQKHGGSIEVRSRPGEGSSFRVWVPVGGPGSVAGGAAPPAWA